MGGEKHAQMTTMGSRLSDKYDEQNRQVQQEIHDSLILDLQDKERAIQQGNNAVHVWIFQMSRIKLLVDNIKMAFFHLLQQLIMLRDVSQKTSSTNSLKNYLP